MNSLTQLQALLRELFQLDLADLDFGLYRLLHLKRKEVETFLTEQLPRHVEEAFQGMVGTERAALEKEVAELATRVRNEVAENGDTATPGIRSLDRLFKRLLEEEER